LIIDCMGIPLLPSAKHIPAAAHIQHQSVLTFAPAATRNGRPVTPRLRLDRVALRLVDSLRVALDGRAVALTITAPIRHPAKTAAAIEGQIRLRLRRRALGRSAHSIHENSVQIWVLKGGGALTSKLVGFVHNPEVDPAVLIELTSALLAAIDSRRCTARTGRRPQRPLLIEDPRGLLSLATYQNVCGQLRLGAVYGEVLVRLSGGRVQKLSARGCYPPQVASLPGGRSQNR
jgi:hypothetical protein